MLFEIEDLLEPIDPERPAGPDLRLDPGDTTFQTLKDLTTEVEPSAAENEGDVREPNWSSAESLCYAALREKSKDLELMANLAACSVRVEGIPAVELGLGLVHRGLELFWDSVHPGVDPDDGEISLALRARWLNWMDSPNGFIQALKRCPIASQGGVAYSWKDYENTSLLDDATLSPERHQELNEAGVISSEAWLAAIGSVDGARIGEYVEVLKRSLDTASALAAFCAEKFQDEDPPDLYNLRGALEEMHDYLAERIGDSSEGQIVAQVGLEPGGGGSLGVGGPIGNRQQALQQLNQICSFFRQTEPHSPISYLIARAVKWGSMPLDQLYKDVVRNDEVIEHLWETLGLDEPKPRDEE